MMNRASGDTAGPVQIQQARGTLFLQRFPPRAPEHRPAMMFLVSVQG